MAKQINFEGAILIVGGGLVDGDIYKRRFWAIRMKDGALYRRAPRGHNDEPGLEMWEKWCEPGPDVYQMPHWRKTSKVARLQLQQWLRAHSDYLPDGGSRD